MAETVSINNVNRNQKVGEESSDDIFDFIANNKSVQDAIAAKEEGNTLFAERNFAQSVHKYTEAIELFPKDSSKRSQNELLSTFYGNRSAAYVSLHKYNDAVVDCTTSLALKPNYVKVLVRRMQSYEKLCKFEDALQDAKRIAHFDSQHPKVTDKIKLFQEKVDKEQMESLLPDPSVQFTDEMIADAKLSPNLQFKLSRVHHAGRGCFLRHNLKLGQKLSLTSNGDAECLQFSNDYSIPNFKLLFGLNTTIEKQNKCWDDYLIASRQFANFHVDNEMNLYVTHDMQVGDELYRSYGMEWLLSLGECYEKVILRLKNKLLQQPLKHDKYKGVGDESRWDDMYAPNMHYIIDKITYWLVGVQYDKDDIHFLGNPDRPENSYFTIPDSTMVVWRERIAFHFKQYLHNDSEKNHTSGLVRGQYKQCIQAHTDYLAYLQEENMFNFPLKSFQLF